MRESYYKYGMDDILYKTFMMPAISVSGDNRNDFDNMKKINNMNRFLSPQEGFLRGNMEAGTYIPYKNMNYIKPNFTNQRQKDLYDLQMMCFAAHEANLYLDVNPKDTNMIRMYNEYSKMEKKLTDEYERKYGPINLSDSKELNMTPWSWINEPWPWKG